LKNKILDLKSNINKQQHLLIQLISKNYICWKLIEKNSSKNNNTSLQQDKLNYPFLLIKLSQNACFTIKEDDSNSKVCIFSDKGFSIIKDEEIMKEFLKNDKKMKNDIKFLGKEINSYVQKHDLLEKYFNNITNFNSNNFNMNDNSMLFATLKKHSYSSILEENRQSLDFLIEKLKNPIRKSFDNDNINLDCFEKVEIDENFTDTNFNGLQDTNYATNFKN